MVCCSSGTSALHLALEAMQLPLRSEALVPDFTMIACPRAVTLAGLTPVFVDCDERLLMDVNCMTNATTNRDVDDPKRFLGRPISAIMAVHVYGRRCDMDYISEATDNWNVKLIEDLAEAHGVRPHPQTDAAAWSFYRNKIVAGEEGGAVWFKDKSHANLARQLRSLGFTDAHDFNHVPRGHNYRMSNVHAELVLRSLRMYAGNHYECGPTWRRKAERWHDEACHDDWRMPKRDAVWVYDLRVKGMTAVKQNEAVKALQNAGIAARHGFKPMKRQVEYCDNRRVHDRHASASAQEGYSKADWAAQEVLYLPIMPGITTEASARLAFDIIGKVLGKS